MFQLQSCETKSGDANVQLSMVYSQNRIVPDDGAAEGRVLALQYCQTCHLFVEPEMLTRRIWEDFVIPDMGARLGMHRAGYDYNSRINRGRSAAERAIIDDAGIFPETPMVPTEHWDKIVDYYLSNALEYPKPPANKAVIRIGLDQFQAKSLAFKRRPPMITMVHIDELSQRLFLGDSVRRSLIILDAKGNVGQELTMNSAPIAVRLAGDDLWVTEIGSVIPSDLPLGELLLLKEVDGKYVVNPDARKLSQLHRPTYTSYGDLNKDGIEDIVMSEFGDRVGKLVWYEGYQGATGVEYKEHVLFNEPGSMTSRIYDFNDDGWDDIAVVFGQNREGVHIFYNLGDGNFLRSYALQVPANYGSSYFDLYDFNDDGHIDILATHGDNGDHPPFLKPHHGIRIYLNDGYNHFEERYFFHMNGAFKALAEDFDEDGDLDIVAISMFADYKDRPEEGFVYLENQGGFRFNASTVPEVEQGRWLTMDVGDLDGDGDKDVVLGSFILPTAVPDRVRNKWQASDKPVLYLENQLR